MKLASFDIGTNSTRLLITDYNCGKFIPLERKMEITRLGKDLGQSNMILKQSAVKTLKVLSGYKELIENRSVEKYRAVGTNAVRKASNRDWFISYIYRHSGIKIDVVSGKEEARLSFCGAVRGMDLKSPYFNTKQPESILVIDIGGGSSEFILGDSDYNLKLIESIDIGCVSLTEKFMGYGIPDASSLDRLDQYISGKLKETMGKINRHKPLPIIGVAGTITTLAAIDLKLKTYDSEKIHRHILSLERIESIYKDLCSLNLEERKKVTGLEPQRADIIIGGTAIFLTVLNMLGSKGIMISEKDILDGIIYSMIDF